ncbi:acyclic terpene utilization AtuA family protein [Actinoplanes sp. NPDC051861]|uniref:acyclic terpene utilization AtuA family protein n=1 Tax=Actinoplanes sp. NPDC051861 TaxID=3155170 RepID=UPI0034439530
MRTIRIGNCSGFYGDRFSAMAEMIEGGQLDYLTGDYLAELTMLILGRDRQKDPSLGYAKTFLRQLAGCLTQARQRGLRIVTNAGGLNPAGLARAVRALAEEQGVEVAVAHVHGDDLLGAAAAHGWPDALTANAYLGAFGIAAALDAGADIVVTGRVTDASLTLGPAIAEFGWGRTDFDRLAAGVVAGHILECGTQATGGNFSGFAAVDITRPLGFPLVELSADGTAVVTKHPGTGGAVTVDTVTAQLVYEVAGPHYANPDVTARLDTVELEQAGPDRVRVTSVRGVAPPPTTKIALNSVGGWRNAVEFVLTGLDIEEKASWVRDQMTQALSPHPPARIEWDLARTDRADPATEAAASAVLRCHVKDPDPAVVGRAFTGAAVELALASYPGFHVTAPPGPGAAFGIYRAEYLPQDRVPHTVVHPDGTSADIAPPPVTAEVPEHVSRVACSSRTPEGFEFDVPLGRLVFARSGDKGGTANVGVWVPAGHPRRAEAYAWLRDWLTPDVVPQLLPESAGLGIDVFALPNLCAVNIVIDGLLGDGVASSTRFDPQAKAVGEWLRARVVNLPKELLP